MSEATEHIKAVSERLLEMNQLPLEVPTYFLQGLTKCSVPDFTGPFELILNQERINQMGTAVSPINNSSVTLRRVRDIIFLANNINNSLNTSNVWIFSMRKHGHHSSQKPHHTPECFNCG